MSEAIEQTWMRRLRYTPLRDLARGRLSGRLDIQRRIDSSGLPTPGCELIGRVVRRTRLWRIEKVEVADELIAHFRDGMEAGISADELVQSFGDERSVAKLIRRAKVRNRSLPWHLMRAVRWAFLCFMILYAIFAVEFLFGRPSLRVNYVDAINERVVKTLPDQRGWPFYRQAILAYRPPTRDPEEDQNFRELLDASPSSADWPRLVNWINDHRRTVEFLHQGAAMPALGYVHGPGKSTDDPELFGDVRSPKFPESSIISLVMPSLGPLHELAMILTAEARIARQERDAQRLIPALESMVHLGRQIRENDSILVTSVFGVMISSAALLEIQATLAEAPELLSDASLARLAHLLAGPQVAGDLFSLRVERIMMADTVQRTFTDDGNGDGQLTLAGLRLFPQITSPGQISFSMREIQLGIGAAAPLIGDSRRQIVEDYSRLYNLAETNLRLPVREADWTEYDEQVRQWQTIGLMQVRTLFGALLPSYLRLHANAETYLGLRDGTLIGLALETWRRAHGGYPESLSSLSPDLLPRMPVDRISGGALEYRIVDSKPLIYSVGRDGDDDGGRAPVSKSGETQNTLAAPYPHQAGFREQMPDGDWIIFPQPASSAD